MFSINCIFTRYAYPCGNGVTCARTVVAALGAIPKALPAVGCGVTAGVAAAAK